MAFDGSVIIKAILDSDEFKKAVNGLGTIAKKGATVAAAAITAIGGALVTAGGYAINLASDLEEVQNVVDVTFGEGAKKVNEFAQSAAKAYGLSELSAKQYASTMGAMLKSMGLADEEVQSMSTSLTGLAGDMASFYNISSDDAFEKLRAGISGEAEPLKQLGINLSVANLEAYALSQGITASYNSMSEAEKVALRYNYIMATTADAQGDFARTSDSLANQLRILQMQGESLAAVVGTALLPVAREAVSAAGEFVTRLNDAFEEGGIEGLVSELGSVLSDALTMLAEAAPDIIDTAVSLIDSFAQGLIDNSDAVVAAAGDILISLASGIISLLPTLFEVAVSLVGSLGEYIIDNIPKLVESGPEIIRGLSEGIISAVSSLSESAGEIIASLVEYILSNLPEILSAGAKIIFELAKGLISVQYTLIEAGASVISGIVQGISGAIGNIKAKAQEIVNTITETLASLKEKAAEYGRNVIQGLVNGITQKWESLKTSVSNVVNKVKSVFTVGFDTHSPSKWAQKIGIYIIQGLGNGLKDSRYAVESAKEAVKTVGDSITSEIEKLNADIEALQEKTVKTQKELDREALENKRNALKDLQKEYESALQSIQRSQENFAKKLSDYGDLYTKNDKTGKINLGAVDENIKALEKYSKILDELKSRGAGQDFLNEFIGLNVDEAVELGESLLKSEDTFQKYLESWNKQQEIAKEIASKYYQDELDTLESEFVNKLDTSLGRVPEETKEVGIDSIDGWISGLESREGALYRTVRRIAEQMISEMRSELDINSPSKKTEKLVGFESAAGVEKGFVERMKIASEKMRSAVSAENLKLTSKVAVQADKQAHSDAGETKTYYSSVTTEKTPVIELKGSLAGLAKALLPYIRVEEKRIGQTAVQGVTE